MPQKTIEWGLKFTSARAWRLRVGFNWLTPWFLGFPYVHPFGTGFLRLPRRTFVRYIKNPTEKQKRENRIRAIKANGAPELCIYAWKNWICQDKNCCRHQTLKFLFSEQLVRYFTFFVEVTVCCVLQHVKLTLLTILLVTWIETRLDWLLD